MLSLQNDIISPQYLYRLKYLVLCGYYRVTLKYRMVEEHPSFGDTCDLRLT